MKKPTRNISDPKSRAFWESVRKSADTVRSAPEWMLGGITLNDTHFVTFEPKAPDGLTSVIAPRKPAL